MTNNTGHLRVLLRLRSEDVTGLERAYRETSAGLAGTPGLLGNELLRDSDRPGAYVVASEWSSEQAFADWEAGPDHRQATAPVRRYQDRHQDPLFSRYVVQEQW